MSPHHTNVRPGQAGSQHNHVVFIAGYGNSGPGHWQRTWHEAMPGSRWIEQDDWDAPDCERWIAAIERQVPVDAAPLVLVAHSLGCLAVVEWSRRFSRDVAGALLVAVPDARGPQFPRAITGFGDVPVARLPFASTIVASSNDPYVTLQRSRDFAERWGSAWRDIGAAGHINAESGLGPWTAGREILGTLMR